MQKFILGLFFIGISQLIYAGHVFVKEKVNQYNNEIVSSNFNYNLLFYEIDLDISDTSIYLNGNILIKLELLSNYPDSISFHFSDNYTIDSIVLMDASVVYSKANNIISIYEVSSYDSAAILDVVFSFSGRGYNVSYPEPEGIFNIKYSSNIVCTYTLTEPFSAFMWLPGNQQLTDKIDSVYINLTVDNDLMVGSNGILDTVIDIGEKKIFKWKSSHPIAYYLISFAVSNYIDYSFYAGLNETDSTLVQNYIYNDSTYLHENKIEINETEDLLKLFSELFGIYPYHSEKYGHCVVPISGGMEHQTMTTLGYFEFKLVAHELAHQWFGNYVTCENWQDIWINEGFASYAEYLALQFLKSQELADEWIEHAHDIALDETQRSIWIPENKLSKDRIFNYRLSYKKGASIIHMLRQEINSDSLFFNILRTFLDSYKNSNAGAEDLKNIIEIKTNNEFDTFFEQWYYNGGFPRVTVQWKYQNDSLYFYIFQESTAISNPIFNFLNEIKIIFNDSTDSIITFRQNSNFQTYSLYLNKRPHNIIYDPNKWLLAEIQDVVDISGLNDDERDVKIVPVPANNLIHIYSLTGKHSYTLYITNINGKIIESFTVNNAKYEYNISLLPQGEYFAILKYKDRIYHRRFIKL